MLDHHLQDSRDRENIADAVTLNEPERLVDVETLRRKQNSRHAARGLNELVDSGAMRQRRHDKRGIVLGRAGRKVCKVVGYDKRHLAMGQHRRLGSSGSTRSKKEPARIIVVDPRLFHARAGVRRNRLADRVLAERPLANPPDECERRARLLHNRGMLGKIAMAQEGLGT